MPFCSDCTGSVEQLSIRVLTIRIGAAIGFPSPLQGEGKVRVFSKPGCNIEAATPHLDPLPLLKGRGEKGCLLASVLKTDNQRAVVDASADGKIP
jgi:hypothetical protein